MRHTAGVTEEGERVVVVIEDDPAIADLVELYLRRDGFRVHQAADAARGLQAIADRRPALVILDVGLPGRADGFDVCRQLRAGSDLPIIMLTARDDEVDRVLGLELGADDYVVKPFSARELMARVKGVLRRSAGGSGRPSGGPIELGATVVVDPARREVTVSERVVPLATREFDLLAFLARNRGLALSRRQLLDGVWGVDWVGDERTVDVHVGQLRRKLGSGFALTTVWGVGYRLE
jgi:DNA-binding response OmpR family regulator